jgi:hypothetical protein
MGKTRLRLLQPWSYSGSNKLTTNWTRSASNSHNERLWNGEPAMFHFHESPRMPARIPLSVEQRKTFTRTECSLVWPMPEVAEGWLSCRKMLEIAKHVLHEPAVAVPRSLFQFDLHARQHSSRYRLGMSGARISCAHMLIKGSRTWIGLDYHPNRAETAGLCRRPLEQQAANS